MSLDPYDVLSVGITTGGRTPSVDECRAIIAQVSQVEYLIKSFLHFQIDADDYLDGINDVEMINTDEYIDGLWLPLVMV
ncbi:MAG TPA: hypothetical protein IGS40_07810 [Trichormus sp. M33_DOE_039]|nr:hypothetical protein [Trichormus sp. M33_DOE_039]